MSEEKGTGTVGEIVEAVGEEIRPTLRGKDAVFGFNLGLEKVRRALGKDSVVWNPNTPGTIEVLETGPFVCPECGAETVKCRAVTESGAERVARVCECDPTGLINAAGVMGEGAAVIREVAAKLGVELETPDPNPGVSDAEAEAIESSAGEES